MNLRVLFVVCVRSLKKHGVHMLSGVTYDKVDNSGLHITVDGQQQLLAVDHVVLCAGQIPLRDLKVC
jgi:2,4-dienoyl-CoA reductase (NADPH2)